MIDGDCRAFDVPNLHVVSTAVLPTSGQANPTLTAVQLGLRLAARLATPCAESMWDCDRCAAGMAFAVGDPDWKV